jgi:hypothetical protein
VSPASLSSPAAPLVPGRAARVTVTAAAALSLVVHLWGLYRDHGPPSVGWFPHADKLEHLVGFGLPCLLVLLALETFVSASERRSAEAAGGRPPPRRGRSATAGRLLGTRAVVVVVGLFVAHAVVSEVVQGTLYTSRSGDPFDAVADVTGTILGLVAYLVLRRRPRSATAGTRTTGQAAHGRA